jgi:hypothetical protein
VVVAVISSLACPAAVLAQQSPSPSVEQYVERVPTAEGPRPSSGDGTTDRDALPPAARRELRERAGSDAEALEAIAGSEALGAPQGQRRGSADAAPGGGGASGGDATTSAGPAVVDAAFDGGGTSLLLVGLVVTTLIAAGVALARRRRA